MSARQHDVSLCQIDDCARCAIAHQQDERAKYLVTLYVADRDYDQTTYEDIGSFSVTEIGMLVVFDQDDRTLAGYAPGAWSEFSVSREDRLESTDDEPKDDNDTPTPE